MPRTLCISCTTEENEVAFDTVKEYMEHQKGGHILPPKTEKSVQSPVKSEIKASEKPIEQPKPKREIVLKYSFVGDCTNCSNTNLDTIEIIVNPEKNICVAFCKSCNSQLLQKEVIPIKQQREREVIENGKESKKR